MAISFKIRALFVTSYLRDFRVKQSPERKTPLISILRSFTYMRSRARASRLSADSQPSNASNSVGSTSSDAFRTGTLPPLLVAWPISAPHNRPGARYAGGKCGQMRWPRARKRWPMSRTAGKSAWPPERRARAASGSSDGKRGRRHSSSKRRCRADTTASTPIHAWRTRARRWGHLGVDYPSLTARWCRLTDAELRAYKDFEQQP